MCSFYYLAEYVGRGASAAHPVYVDYRFGRPRITRNPHSATHFKTRTDCLAHIKEWCDEADFEPREHGFESNNEHKHMP